MSAFSQGEGCGEHGSSRVGLLARGPRRQGGKLGIVVVQHMTLNAVYQRGVLGAKFPRRAEYGGSATLHLTGKVSAQNLAGLFLGAAKHGRQTVEQVKLGLLAHRRRNIPGARPRDKFTDVFGGGFAGEGRETHVWRLTRGDVTCTSAFAARCSNQSRGELLSLLLADGLAGGPGRLALVHGLAGTPLDLGLDVIANPLFVPPLDRQDGSAVQIDAKVQMISRRQTGFTGFAEGLSLLDLLAGFDVDGAQVGVQSKKPHAVIDNDGVAVD